MSMIPRLDRAIEKLNKQLTDIPVDERVPDNRDYTRVATVLQSLRAFKLQIENMEKMLDRLGV